MIRKARTHSEMKIAVLDWRGESRGYIECRKGKDNEGHIRRHI
jgi:hypothetical protein